MLRVTKLRDHILDELYWKRGKEGGIHFNELFRLLRQKGAVGSHTTLSKTLKEMLDQGLIEVEEKKHPGLSKKVYHIAEKGTSRIEEIFFEYRKTITRISKAIRKTKRSRREAIEHLFVKEINKARRSKPFPLPTQTWSPH